MRPTVRLWLIFALLTVASSACVPSSSEPDARTSMADAPSSETDAPSSETDAPSSETDAPSPVAEDAPTVRGDVTACEELARTFRDNCEETNGPTDVRVCLWERYGQLCTIGNTALLLEAMRCLDASTCRTFSDANDGNACLDALHATDQPAALRAVIEGQCAACGATDCSTSASRAEVLPYVLPSDASALDACTTSDTCSIDAMIDACDAIAGIAPFTACTM